jgi:putative transposase
VKGLDANKKVKGRKRHIIVDTNGLLLYRWVHSAGIVDCHAGLEMIGHFHKKYPTVKAMFLDDGYKYYKLKNKARRLGIKLEYKQKPEGAPKGFVAIKKRWVVERSFGWMNLCRQLSKEYDQLAEVSEAWCDLATIYMLLRRRSGRSVVWN